MTLIPNSLVGWALDFHIQTDRLTRRAQFKADMGFDNRTLIREIDARHQVIQTFFDLLKEVKKSNG